jgi:uncharacterized protein YndB with AHSA1/START domain
MSTTDRKGEQQQETIEIRKSIVIEASTEVVFKAITDPEELTNWFLDQAILESKVGGRYKFSFNKQENNEYLQMDYFPEGTITEFIPNKKITYTWQEPNIADFPRTVVTWELEKLEKNKTRLYLSHTGFRADEMAKNHDEGWSHFLSELAEYCKNRK